MLTTAELAVLVCLAVIVQAVTGSGFGVIAAPAMVALDPALVPGPLLVLTLAVMAVEVWRGRRHLAPRTLITPLLGYVAATPIALAVLPHLHQREIALVVAIVLIIATGAACLGWKPQGTPSHLAVAGGFSALAGLLAGLPGPPLVIVYRDPDAHRLRANLAAYFAVTAGFSSAALAAQGRLSGTGVIGALWWLPVVVAAGSAAGGVIRIVPAAWMRPLTLAVSLCGAIVLLARA